MIPSWHTKQAIHALKRGGIIAYPTEAVYGLGCDPFNQRAVSKLFALKKRSPQKGLILLGSTIEQFQRLLKPIPANIQAKLERTWPGPVTWLLPARSSVPRYLRGQHNTLAIRISDLPIIQQLCTYYDQPIISTSANVSGHKATKTHMHCRRAFNNKLNYILVGEIGHLTSPTEIRDAFTNHIIRAA